MAVTTEYLLNSGYLKGVKLWAGKSGTSKVVTGCSILEYEFDKSLGLFKVFKEGHIVVTTFQYAKDNEFLIFDAIKQLLDQKISALIIKNVYKLTFGDMLARVADARELPIFFADNNTELADIIKNVYEGISSVERSSYIERIVKSLIFNEITSQEAGEKILEIFPNTYNTFRIICIDSKNIFVVSDNLRGIELYYKDKAFIITPPKDGINIDIKCGISDFYEVNNIGDAIWESIYGYLISDNKAVEYSNIGSKKVIFPMSRLSYAQKYSNSILNEIEYYDIRYSSKLMETLEAFVEAKGSIAMLSNMLFQHENTLRHRLKKIKEITGLDFKDTEDYGELSMAVEIRKCGELIEEFLKGCR